MAEDTITIDLFAEDKAHELFVFALLRRILAEAGVDAQLNRRWAQGGHGRALAALKLYQSAVLRGLAGFRRPALLVVVIDANCNGWAKARNEIRAAIQPGVAAEVIVGCPDPHIERWFFADPAAFSRVVGVNRQPGRLKCTRDRYKALLREAVLQAGHPPTLSGLEFASEIAQAMDLYIAGRNDTSLGHFIEEIRAFVARHVG